MTDITLTFPSESVCMGKELTFTAPCNCENAGKLIIGDSQYDIVDAAGKPIAGNPGYWISGALVTVVLDTTSLKAYVLNAAIANLVPTTLEAHTAMVEGGTIDEDTYYFITDDNDTDTDPALYVKKTDSADNLTTTTDGTYLDGKQGKILKDLVDELDDDKAEVVHSHTVSEIEDLTVTAEELNSVDGVTGNIQSQLDAVEDIAKGATIALSYADYSTMITAVNAMDNTELRTGQNIYIGNTEVPDLWIYSVEATSVEYTFTTNAALIASMSTNVFQQIGYYTVAMLETQKVNLTDYITASQLSARNYAGSTSDGGAATSALKLDTARNINGIAFDGSGDISTPSMYESNSIYKHLSSVGWYRIARIYDIGNNNFSAIVDLSATYNATMNASHRLSIVGRHGVFSVVQLNGSMHSTVYPFSKVRIIGNSNGSEAYIEAYYSRNDGNGCYAHFASYFGEIEVYQFTIGSIPDGYTATEFNLSSSPIKTDAIVSNAVGKNNYIAYPDGGMFVPSANCTGYLKITLPLSWSNTMIKFKISIYNYVAYSSCDYYVCGYIPSASAAWYCCTAYSIGSPLSKTVSDLPVRFGHDGSKCAIYIGESTTTWTNPKISVSDIVLGYQNFDCDTWKSGWSISITDTLGTITATITNPFIGSGYLPNETVPISKGGTGATTADVARTNLKAPVNYGPVGAADLNTLVDSGFYRTNNGNANLPSGCIYGNLVVSRGADTCGQIYCTYATSKMYYRGGVYTETGWYFSPWTEFLSRNNSKPVAIQSTAPTDTTALWIDSTNMKSKIYKNGAWTALS